MDQVADGRPGNLAVDPRLELDQIALGGAGEGWQTARGSRPGRRGRGLCRACGGAYSRYRVAPRASFGRQVLQAKWCTLLAVACRKVKRVRLSLLLDEKPRVIAGVHTCLASA